MQREKEEKRVRRALVSMGEEIMNVTKRTIEETVRGLLGVSKLRLSRAELMDLAKEVFDERSAVEEKELVEAKEERVKEQKQKQIEIKEKAKPRKTKKKAAAEKEEENDDDEDAVAPVREPPAKKKKGAGKQSKQQLQASERAAIRQRALELQAKSGWTLQGMLEQAGHSARPQLFCRRCGTLLPAAQASHKHVGCLVCGHRTPVSNVVGRETVSHWRPRVASKLKAGPANRSTIAMRCENAACDAEIVQYYQMQLRSADEGSTTFYECQKCGFKWNENN
jgi:DNA-directed RNA polymerase I subunit RPA12